jgi:hypothetical protein
MNTNNRRPDGWTSADAAGLAILPGLVRYDEAYDPAITDIGHAFRVTVRATNGYVYPASHRAGSTSGALPMGARLRLKTNVGGVDPATRTSDPICAEDLSRNAEIRRARRRQRLRHVHRRNLRHALEQRRSESRVLDFVGERFRGDSARLESAAIGSCRIEFDRCGSVVGDRRQSVDRDGDAQWRGSGRWRARRARFQHCGGGRAAVGHRRARRDVGQLRHHDFGSLVANDRHADCDVRRRIEDDDVHGQSSAPAARSSVGEPDDQPGQRRRWRRRHRNRESHESAPAGGAMVSLSSSNTGIATVPSSVGVAAGATSATFTISTKTQKKNGSVSISANYAGVAKSATLTVKRR